MLKKVMAVLASKYMAIKVRIRAIETHFMIQALLLRDRKMIRHLFRRRKCFNLSNKVKVDDDEDEYQAESIDALLNDSIATTPLINSSVSSTPVSVVAVAEEAEENDSIATTPLINSSVCTTPVSVVAVAEEAEEKMEMEDDDECPELRHSLSEDDREENRSVSVIEMVKNAKEGRGKKFILEEDIDKVADLFIQRFHHQIRLQKRYSEEDRERDSD